MPNPPTLRIRHESNHDELDFDYNYVIVCEHTGERMFLMNAKRKRYKTYLVNDIIRVTDNTLVSNHHLMWLDSMLVPIQCDTEEDSLVSESFFHISDFANYLDIIRRETYPEWDSFTFADYYLQKYHFRWTNTMMLRLGKHLGTPAGLVRHSFFKNVADFPRHLRNMVTDYVDTHSGNVILTYNRFDTNRQPFYQVIMSGDPTILHNNTPLEFRKENVLYLDKRNRWANRRFPPTLEFNPWSPCIIPSEKVFASVQIILVRWNRRGEQTRTPFNTFISNVNHESFELKDPVVCTVNVEDSIYFECKISETFSHFTYLRYRYAAELEPDACGNNAVCRVRNVKWRSNQSYERQGRFHSAMKGVCRVYLATKQIQRHWRNCIANPSYKMCQKRLSSEFEQLTHVIHTHTHGR